MPLSSISGRLVGGPEDPFVDTVLTNGQEKPYTVFGTRWISTVVQTTGAEGTSENGFPAACGGSKAEDFKAGQGFTTGNSQQNNFAVSSWSLPLMRLFLAWMPVRVPVRSKSPRLYLHYTTSFPTPCHPVEFTAVSGPARSRSRRTAHRAFPEFTAALFCHPAEWGH
jgi:hypothetical protein